MARLSASEQIKRANAIRGIATQKADAQKAAAVKPNATMQAKPAAKPSRADALAAIANQGPDEKKRADIIKNMQNLPPFSGKVLVNGKQYPIVKGSLNFNGAAYQVSKDGRCVINNNLMIVGEIRGGVMGKPTAAFLNEMKFLGELK